MTTLAYDGRYIAAEGRETMGGVICRDDTDKFYQVGANLFALCGETPNCIKFAKDFKDGLEVSYSDCGGFLFVNGNIYLVFVDRDEKKICMNQLTTKYWADGSGRDWAIAALDHGKTAVEAVKYAITRDSCSGGLIRCFDTQTCKFIKVKQ